MDGIRSVARMAIALVGVLGLISCSDDDGNDAGTSGPGATLGTSSPATAVLPLVDQIDEAVAALEAQLGGPQDYFEINATAQLVNLFVALNNAAVAQPWLYLGDTLTAGEGQPAGGGTFQAASMDFDPDVILATVLEELPDLTIESFYVNGDGQGNVLYGVLATSSKGGGLDVVLSVDGSVKSVDPVN